MELKGDGDTTYNRCTRNGHCLERGLEELKIGEYAETI